MTISLSQVTHLITIDPEIEVTIQQLINAIRAWEASQENLDCNQVGLAAGKDDLGSGLMVGITLNLLDGWQVQFKARGGPDYIQCVVKDGNLVGGIAGNPIKPSAFTWVKVIQSAAGTISELGDVAQEVSLQDLRDKIGFPTSTVASDLDQIEERTNNLPDDPADQSEIIKELAALKRGGSFRG